MSAAGILLAAGAASRFGDIKQLAEIDGQPMLLRTLERLNASSLSQVVVVLGANHELIQAALPAQTQVVINPKWATGMSASIQAGLAFLTEKLGAEMSSAMIALGDQVGVNSADFQSIIDLQCAYPNNIIAATYAGTTGVPASFPRRYFTQLANLVHTEGAKSLLTKYQAEVLTYRMLTAAFDIDTPQDLAAWQQQQKTTD